MKRLKIETSNLDRSWGTYESFLVRILGAIGHVIRVSELKNEMPIVGLNSSSSKTNGTWRIKLSNLEASGHACQISKINHDDSDTSFFLYLFIDWNFRDALRRKSLCFFRHILRILKQK